MFHSIPPVISPHTAWSCPRIRLLQLMLQISIILLKRPKNSHSKTLSRNKLVPLKYKVWRGILPRCVKTSSVDVISSPACDMHYLPNSLGPQPHESQPIPTSPPSTRPLSLQPSLESWIASHFPSFASNVARIRIPAIARWWVQH